MNQKIDFLGTTIYNLSILETLSLIGTYINKKEKIIREDVNAAKIVWMHNDPQFREIIHKADVINADGQSVIFASKLLGRPIKERVPGIDLMEHIIAHANKKQWKIFFLGATEEVIKKTVNTYTHKYSKDIIAGYHHGYFDEKDEKKIVDLINISNANILFIGMPSPQKEYFVHKYFNKLSCNLIMGVGGSFDVVSGKVNRAPVWMQKSGLEWLYRLLQEPGKMWKRYLYTNSMFLWLVFKEKTFKKQGE
jgi:N-acetylglucosaminyldiphosphoundecaprenol N-acetyl-beta-D-mannosaminyltransferase